MPVFEIYTEKTPEFAVEAACLQEDLKAALHVAGLKKIRVVNRYFIENISKEHFAAARDIVFSQPQTDVVFDKLPDFGNARVFASEYLPGQFDQRADSAEQCIALGLGCECPVVKTARIYAFDGDLTDAEIDRIKAYLINPVESREVSPAVPATIIEHFPEAKDIETIVGFRDLDKNGLKAFSDEYSLAMDSGDLTFCRDYFKKENRDPTVTEIRMIDTYWSDHCRHTTFLTHIDSATIEEGEIAGAWREYLALREKLYHDKAKPVTLMDMATIGVKALKAQGYLTELDESGEINACSVKITVDVDGRDEDWLLMFKNETHNHPTEIEPFGGAATCLGGAIRDPLSGRSYVYQAMRVTGAADPTETAPPAIKGKLSQRKLVQTAAAGYSSYGNQIGLAAGHVHEIYHPGYVAKRMELGAVIGAVPASSVVREEPEPGDVVILLGGRTGRDGCGGATGSSKSHTAESLHTCGAEVQKGDAPQERKIVRLFRNPEATRMIKRCNDFGAGGVSVSIGELADGIDVSLDAVPVKYGGLNGTELAISESQERMSIVVAPADADAFIRLAGSENLEATIVAVITKEPRLVMKWRGKKIVDLSREFLNSNGATKHTSIEIPKPDIGIAADIADTGEKLMTAASDLRFCSQKGLVERFDATAGGTAVLMPLGGREQLTPAQVMASRIPVLGGETTACSVMSWGYSPEITCRSAFDGGRAAVVESVAKVIAVGGGRKQCWLSMQEYFERLKTDPLRWGKPAAALLGALQAQLGLKLGAIGGKDSMSGTFEDIDVPPTLVSFAVSLANAENIISPEFKKPGSRVYHLTEKFFRQPDYTALESLFDKVERLIAEKKIRSAWALQEGGTAVAVMKMCFGNRIGFKACAELDFTADIGGFVVEADELPEPLAGSLLGETVEDYAITLRSGERVDLSKLQEKWEERLEGVYPVKAAEPQIKTPEGVKPSHKRFAAAVKISKPRVLIPVFPGTSCEYETARAFTSAGAKPEVFVIKNLTTAAVRESTDALAKRIKAANILALPGGMSGGGEPDGAAKFIAAFLRNPEISEQVMELLNTRDGLICGISDGFQALVRLGLLPYGNIGKAKAEGPVLAQNIIGRRQSKLVHTKVMSNASPWLQGIPAGSVFTLPVSYGEGRFAWDEKDINHLWENAQIATVYVGDDGNPSNDVKYNPGGAAAAVEGLLSPDGRVFGKMAHCERYGENLYKNVPGEKFMDIFSGAVSYYG